MLSFQSLIFLKEKLAMHILGLSFLSICAAFDKNSSYIGKVSGLHKQLLVNSDYLRCKKKRVNWLLLAFCVVDANLQAKPEAVWTDSPFFHVSRHIRLKHIPTCCVSTLSDA